VRGVSPDLQRLADVIAARGGVLGKPLHLLAETQSTNDDAKAGARAGAPHGSVWVAETQARGRGRQGRRWVSRPGENLLFSVLLRIPCLPSRVPPISLVCGLAVRDAVAKAGLEVDGQRVLVKWPNDVVVQSRDGSSFRKIAGILVESALSGGKVEHVVIGVGVNVHARDFEGELSGIATSIALEAPPGSAPDRAEILADILASLDHDVEHVAHRGLGLVHTRLSAHDALLGREVETDDGGKHGVANGIDAEGRLLVKSGDGHVRRIVSGEVRAALRP
jgi:BirA family biotin operon repressor/biotin-[acetyl-CoA-carboxylase] ligase